MITGMVIVVFFRLNKNINIIENRSMLSSTLNSRRTQKQKTFPEMSKSQQRGNIVGLSNQLIIIGVLLSELYI